MQRWISLVLGVAVVALAAILVMRAGSSHGALPAGDGGLGRGDGGAGSRSGDAAESPDAERLPDLPTFPMLEPRGQDGGVGWTMPDGTPVPPLPATAPRQVKIGGVLVVYAGAEAAPKGSRSKAAAKELADKLDADAKNEFHSAVVNLKADQGMAFDEIGLIYRGSLEPAIEYIVFDLPVGGVSDVIETPRGYWIVKRIE